MILRLPYLMKSPSGWIKSIIPNGDKFIIKCHNNSKENCYIERIALNGKELSECLLPHKEYAKGGILELWLSNSAPVK